MTGCLQRGLDWRLLGAEGKQYLIELDIKTVGCKRLHSQNCRTLLLNSHTLPNTSGKETNNAKWGVSLAPAFEQTS